MYESLADVPEPIREYYYEDTVSEPTGNKVEEPYTYEDGNGESVTTTRLVDEYEDVTYIVQKTVGERKTLDQLKSLVVRGKPKLDLQAELVANNEYWKYFDTYQDYLVQLDQITEFNNNVDNSDLDEGVIPTKLLELPVEPVKPIFRSGSEILSTFDRERFKKGREEKVNNIKVTVDGMEFDGDEVSQARMSRAIVVMDNTETVVWVLADNTPVSITKDQLVRALKLSGQEQASLWV